MLDLITLGDSVVDLIIRVEHLPIHSEDSQSGILEREAGGAANLLITASRLGLRVGLIDRVGRDGEGALYLQALRGEGVDVSMVRKVDEPTALCIVLVDAKGGHAYIGLPGATDNLSVGDLDEEYIKASSSLYVSGYTLISQRSREAVMRAVEIAEDEGLPIYFDPSPKVRRIGSETLRRLISTAEVVLLNEAELEAITGTRDPDGAHRLQDSGAEVIVVKRGASGCLIAWDGELLNIPAYRVEAIDPTGAGDAFNAAFIYAHLKGWPPEDAGRLANAVGALTTMRIGAGRRVPTRAEINSFLMERDVGRRV